MMAIITISHIAILAMSGLALAVPAQHDQGPVNDGILIPRIVCADARDTPCDTMCCTPLQQCAYLELVGWACWEKDVSSSGEPSELALSTYTEPDLNTMLITAHDDSATLTATAIDPALSTIPISAHGNSSITAAPTSRSPTSGANNIPTGSETAAVTTTTRNSAGRVDFRGFEMMVLASALMGYLYFV